MSEGFVGIQEAMHRKGLRLVMLRGLPSPWSQAARGIFHVKGIDFAKVHVAPTEPRELLNVWTGQDSFPAAMQDDERPRSGWEEILWLAERLAPSPRLVPRDPEARLRMFGLARELCGEMGLGWCRRLIAMAPILVDPPPGTEGMGKKYGSSAEEAQRAVERIVEILGVMNRQLASSHAAGHRYLMGPELCALDIYWATFCNLLAPLPPQQLPMDETLRAMFTATEAEIVGALETPDASLLAHRDFIYAEHLELPVEL